jgi:peptide-methionine (S)-S-oxide reductase
VQIDYDPSQVTYQELLDVFWSSHDPTTQSWSRQYASILFYHDSEQERLARESLERRQDTQKAPIVTEILPFSEFYPAEAYHQKYHLRRNAWLLEEFKAIYPDDDDLMNSTAAARVNGYVGGYGTLDTYQAQVDQLGLSAAASERLRGIVASRSR